MQVSIKTRYGLRAMVYLARVGRLCSVKEISQKEKIPFDFLEKIFSKLRQKDLIKSRRGARGGYVLAKSPQKISVREILKVLENTTFSVFCQKDYSCRRKKGKCRIKDVWGKIEESLDSSLNSITLADLVEEKYEKEKRRKI